MKRSYELGCALVKTGRWMKAAPQFEAAASQMKPGDDALLSGPGV